MPEKQRGFRADLFEDLTEVQSFAVRQGPVSIHHTGWEPDRELAASLVDAVSDRITEAEYTRRARAQLG